MVVDDDDLIRDLTVTALSYCVNREVMSFGSSVQALRFFEKGGTADIVISDVDMPEMTGLELMHRAKKQDPEMIFIIMSGVAEYESKSRLAGAAAFLAKPFGINDLFSIIQYYVVGPTE